jgi:hypothetical protein
MPLRDPPECEVIRFGNHLQFPTDGGRLPNAAAQPFAAVENLQFERQYPAGSEATNAGIQC